MDEFRPTLRLLMSYVSAVREIDSQLPSQCLHVLLVVASRPGATLREITKQTSLAESSVWRNVASLSVLNHKMKPGYGLVSAVPSVTDSKALSIYLTEKGKITMQRLLQTVTGRSAETFNPPTVR